MSTISFVEKTCFVCGATNRYGDAGIISMNAATGLDGHPGNLTPLYSAISLCPNCGYAAPDITAGTEEIIAITKQGQYQQLVANESIPEVIRKYIAWALIQKETGNPCEAARSMLCATWFADQADNNSSLASQCRRKAIELMAECRGGGGSFEMTSGREILTVVDLYRREGEFDDALEMCQGALMLPLSEEEEFLLRYEEKLCQEKNSLFRTKDDAEREL